MRFLFLSSQFGISKLTSLLETSLLFESIFLKYLRFLKFIYGNSNTFSELPLSPFPPPIIGFPILHEGTTQTSLTLFLIDSLELNY